MHTARDKKKLVTRIRRLRGQLDAVERALEDEKDCAAIMNTVAAVRGGLTALMAELVADHVRFHILGPEHRPSASQRDAGEELIDVVRAYVK